MTVNSFIILFQNKNSFIDSENMKHCLAPCRNASRKEGFLILCLVKGNISSLPFLAQRMSSDNLSAPISGC